MRNPGSHSHHDPSRTSSPGEPYCGECGYVLTGLTESAHCPECGTPIVECLHRGSWGEAFKGRRFESDARLFGYPVLCVAMGPDPEREETRGHAKGIIAIGDIATGGIAVGGMSFGFVSVGGLGVGICSIGGGAVGLATSLGGLSIGGFATGGGAIGLLATGGGAVGIVAQGGLAVGVYARGGQAIGRHTIDQRGANDPKAQEAFDTLTPLMGVSHANVLGPAAAIAVIDAVVIALILLVSVLVMRLGTSRRPEEAS